MKEIEMYECDMCKKLFEYKHDCEYHEQDHYFPVSVVMKDHKYIKGELYPMYVAVLFENGHGDKEELHFAVE